MNDIIEQLQIDFSDTMNDPFFGEEVSYNGMPVYCFIYRDKFKINAQRFDKSNSSNEVRYDISIRVSKYDVPSVKERTDVVELDLKGDGNLRSLRVASIIDQDPATFKLGLIA